MRANTLLVLLGLTLLCACPRPGEGAGNGKGWVPGDGLPPEWPLKQLSLPADAKLFEGHVDEAQDGGQEVTVFFTAPGDWAAVMVDVEGKLGPLKYLRMPQGEAASGGPAAQSQAWCSPNGKLAVLLTYDEDPAAVEKIGQAGYYTLLLKEPKDALPVDPAWVAIP